MHTTDSGHINLSLHEPCLARFGTIVTINYDTLFERAAIHGGVRLPFRVLAISARGEVSADYSYGQSNAAGGASSRTIVKRHGTFPFDAALQASQTPMMEDTLAGWRGEDEVIATASQYDERIAQCLGRAANFAEGLKAQVQAVVAPGYGMASEDHLVSHFLRGLGTTVRLSMTYAGDEVDEARLGIHTGFKSLVLPGSDGGGDVSRAAFARSTWESITRIGRNRRISLGDPELVCLAIQHTAAAGMLRISHLRLAAALDAMPWDRVTRCAEVGADASERVKSHEIGTDGEILDRLIARAKQEHDDQRAWTNAKQPTPTP